ncbi:MAG TPA: hypothetical protein VHE35_00890 [Kofleriaceae bacterium]|nr:hypothetical protein [Kofleriaceae bacterium]
MRAVSVNEAGGAIAELLAAVEAGEEIAIQRNGVVVARLVPPVGPPRARPKVIDLAGRPVVTPIAAPVAGQGTTNDERVAAGEPDASAVNGSW